MWIELAKVKTLFRLKTSLEEYCSRLVKKRHNEISSVVYWLSVETWRRRYSASLIDCVRTTCGFYHAGQWGSVRRAARPPASHQSSQRRDVLPTVLSVNPLRAASVCVRARYHRTVCSSLALSQLHSLRLTTTRIVNKLTFYRLFEY